ncbi:MAG: hypothetical protein GVY10_05160 [Verrucomicrobia bacterium]|jgi:hypothetical protein|nr:hypothetical protein [Verrucomicrobiota bacterium]
MRPLARYFAVLALGLSGLPVPSRAADPLEATYPLAREVKEAAEEWLLENFRDKGLFIYRYHPPTARRPDRNNTIRQLMASIIVARRAQEDPEWMDLHRRNLRFVDRWWYREDAFGGYIFYNEKSKLGANALYLRTLLASPMYPDLQNRARKVFDGILALQSLDGSFSPWYDEPPYAYDRERLLYFYSGEALLALVEYWEKTGDALAEEAAIRSAAYYLDRYVDGMEDHYYPAYVPWHTLCYEKLYRLTGKERYLAAVFKMNDRLLQLLDREAFPGRFYNPQTPEYGNPHAASDGIYLESLAIACRLARETGERIRTQLYEDAIRLAVGYLHRLQIREIQPNWKAPPHRYLGAIPRRTNSRWIRVDNMQHAIDGMEQVLELRR